MAKKRKERKASKDLLYPNALSHNSPQNLPYTYLCRKKAIASIVYVPCLCIHSHTSFYVQFESHGKVAVYGGVHVCSVPVLYCASLGSTASTHSYMMKYQDTKVFITTLDPQIR
jgi:hypothetical protein